MIFFDQDSAYVFPGFPADIDQIVPKFIKRIKELVQRGTSWYSVVRVGIAQHCKKLLRQWLNSGVKWR